MSVNRRTVTLEVEEEPSTRQHDGENRPDEGRDDVLEQEPDQIAGRAVGVGRQRLDRSPFDILVTAVIGGVEVSLGALAAMLVLGSSMAAAPSLGLYGGLALAGVVFPIGFFLVIHGRSELFTENFLIPVVAVFNRNHRARELLSLWALSLLGNLLGCVLMALILAVPSSVGTPIIHGYEAYTRYKLNVPNWGLFMSAILAGLTMTVLTWLLVAVRHPIAKAIGIFAAGYVVFATNMSHAIVSAAIVFAGFFRTGNDVLDVTRYMAITVVGNLVGGVGLVTLFRLAQAKEKQRRR